MGIFANLVSIRNKQAASHQANDRSRYRGVQVIGNGPECCDAVRAIAGKRFLSTEVPKLPLPGCDAAECRCDYELFDDRRTATRRSEPATGASPDGNRSDASPGRRCED